MSWSLGWKSVSLTSLGVVFNGGTPNTKNPDYWNGQIPWITGADITSMLVSKGRKYITEFGLKNSATHLVPKGTILIVTRTGVGKVGVAENDLCFSQDITGLVCSDDVNPFYVARYLSFISERLKRFERGATIKGISRDVLDSIKVPLPTLETQNKIVATIEKVESIIQSRALASKLTNQLLQSVFLEVFGDIAKNSKGWEIKKINDVAEQGTLRNPELTPDEYFEYVDISGVDNKIGVIRASRKIKGIDSPSRARKIIQTNDIIISTVRPNLNATAIVPKGLDNQICSTGFCVLRCKGNIHPYYLYQLTRHQYFINYLSKIMKGASYPAISENDILQMPIPIPPKSIQDYFSSIMVKYQMLNLNQQKSQEQVDCLFNAIMHKAFIGELNG